MKGRKHKESPAASDSRSPVPAGRKVKGAAQMVVGTALAVAGVPMCILPGPGVAAIAGGAALASRGQRNFTGRDPSHVEQRLEAAAQKMGEVAKDQAGRAARAAAKEAPVVAKKACSLAGRGVVAAARGTATLVAKGARAARDCSQS